MDSGINLGVGALIEPGTTPFQSLASINVYDQTDDNSNFFLYYNDAVAIDQGAGTDSNPYGSNMSVPGDNYVGSGIGETIVDATNISFSKNWGIQVTPGTRDPGTNAPNPGTNNPLSVDNNPTGTTNNPLAEVGGVGARRNNVINQFGSGQA